MASPIPQPPGLPLLGNIRDIDPSNTWSSLKVLAEKYGEIFQIKVLGHKIVFVAGAALAEELCDEKRFRKYVGGPIVEIRYTVHDSLFTAFDHEASWGIAHRIIAPKLTPSSIGERFDDMNSTATELIQKWHGLGADNTISPIGELNRLNLEATTLALFGKRLNGLEGPEHPVIQAMEDATSEAMKRPNRPGFLNWLLYGKKFKSATTTIRSWAADLVKHRRENPTDRNDLLTAMLSAKDPESGSALTDSQVVDEIVTMPIGSSTAPCVISAAIYFMLKNPSVVATARKEIDAVVGSDELTHAHVSQLPYVEGIVREALRLSFAAPGFNIEPIPSESKAPIVLGGGKYEVAHNQPMIVVLAGVNRDPAVFEDPLAFRPERMVGDAYESLPAGVKKGFGNGKRECIGKHYAWLWLIIVTTRLIKDVDFEEVDPSYELQQDGWFNLRPVGFSVKVNPRTA
ncbi:cytochrome P450 [Dactylonectria estremocensis]|uniref:Bifunctional cytochrome P450/NADPH--P450 reductase n=1 Tax=Dactylonectria estremocensis TaxID=1079267 RepID=A0A9P9J521_9HYPO|nr:cytochrome P450 [Dactylonectria estremocensis]